MRVEKVKCKVIIICRDGSLVKGVIHINEGERITDFINDSKETFIPVTDAEIHYTKTPRPLSVLFRLSTKREIIFLNKSAIKWIEEVK